MRNVAGQACFDGAIYVRRSTWKGATVAKATAL
jgi:hypothetical protein